MGSVVADVCMSLAAIWPLLGNKVWAYCQRLDIDVARSDLQLLNERTLLEAAKMALVYKYQQFLNVSNSSSSQLRPCVQPTLTSLLATTTMPLNAQPGFTPESGTHIPRVSRPPVPNAPIVLKGRGHRLRRLTRSTGQLRPQRPWPGAFGIKLAHG